MPPSPERDGPLASFLWFNRRCSLEQTCTYAYRKKRTMVYRMQLLILLISVVMLAACGTVSPPTTEGQDTEIVAQMTRSGGLQGRTERLAVARDGIVMFFNENRTEPLQTIQVPQAQVEALESAFASREWQQLETSYGEQTPDAFAYTIIGGGKQVTTYDGATNPPILDKVLQQMNDLWQAVKASKEQTGSLGVSGQS
jgi:hypothetical protein